MASIKNIYSREDDPPLVGFMGNIGTSGTGNVCHMDVARARVPRGLPLCPIPPWSSSSIATTGKQMDSVLSHKLSKVFPLTSESHSGELNSHG